MVIRLRIRVAKVQKIIDTTKKSALRWISESGFMFFYETPTFSPQGGEFYIVLHLII